MRLTPGRPCSINTARNRHNGQSEELFLPSTCGRMAVSDDPNLQEGSMAYPNDRYHICDASCGMVCTAASKAAAFEDALRHAQHCGAVPVVVYDVMAHEGRRDTWHLFGGSETPIPTHQR